MDKYFMWIHYERLHKHNKAKHKKPCAYFLGYTVEHLNIKMKYSPGFLHWNNTNEKSWIIQKIPWHGGTSDAGETLRHPLFFTSIWKTMVSKVTPSAKVPLISRYMEYGYTNPTSYLNWCRAPLCINNHNKTKHNNRVVCIFCGTCCVVYTDSGHSRALCSGPWQCYWYYMPINLNPSQAEMD